MFVLLAMLAGVRQPALVTGATGFIGRRLVCRLIDLKYEVFCLVRPRSRTDELRAAGAVMLPGDVTDSGSVERAMSGSRAGVVFHLAGLVNAQRWGAGRGDFMGVNAGGVETVATACKGRTDPPILVVVSSLAAAGPGEEMRVEDDVPAPVSEYGRSKLAGEVAAAKVAGAMPITVVRPPIVFGPGDRGVLQMVRSISRFGVHLVPGRGDCRLSMVHVDDLVDGLLLVAEKGERLPERGSRAGRPGQGVYFMGGADETSLVQVGRAIAIALGKRAPAVVHLPAPLARLAGFGGDVAGWLRHRPGWVNGDRVSEALAGSWRCSSTKARTGLGWISRVSLAEGLAETAAWYRREGWL